MFVLSISKIGHMGICPPENLQFSIFFMFARALFKTETAYDLKILDLGCPLAIFTWEIYENCIHSQKMHI